MKCPQCTKEGKKSQVYPGMCTTTLLFCPPYYDEDGKYHNHDSNTTTTQYKCSNGHEWVENTRGSCWCGWGKTASKEEEYLK